MRSCPVCDSDGTWPFFRLESAPVLCHRLCRTREEAVAQPRGEIELSFCENCGLVYNRAFDGGLISYDGAYENALHYSGVFREYISRLVSELSERHGLRGGTIAEIGCGDGQFLEAMCRLGGNRGIGFDPAFDEVRHGLRGNDQITIIPRLFDEELIRDADVRLVCCRQVLEHIERPARFLRAIHDSLDRGVPVFFEVPSVMHMLLNHGFWDIIYEHVSYFAPTTIRTLFENSGFGVSRIAEEYSGQFLTVDAYVESGNQGVSRNPDEVQVLSELIKEFSDLFSSLRDQWRQRLGGFRSDGVRVVFWGAGSKTVMFLNNLSIDPESVPYVVDRNPRKHGNFIVGTGQRIIAPSEITAVDPDVVLLLNSAYQKEVEEELSALGSSATLGTVF